MSLFRHWLCSLRLAAVHRASKSRANKFDLLPHFSTTIWCCSLCVKHRPLETQAFGSRQALRCIALACKNMANEIDLFEHFKDLVGAHFARPLAAAKPCGASCWHAKIWQTRLIYSTTFSKTLLCSLCVKCRPLAAAKPCGALHWHARTWQMRLITFL